MDRLFDFVANHWWLVGIWGAFLLALLWDNNRLEEQELLEPMTKQAPH